METTQIQEKLTTDTTPTQNILTQNNNDSTEVTTTVVPIKTRKQQARDKRNSEIIIAYETGIGLPSLSKKFGLSETGIRNILINSGVYGGAETGMLNHAKHLEKVRSGTIRKQAQKTTDVLARLTLIEMREASGLTQEQFADKVGISREYYNKVEKNRVTPSTEVWESIASVFGLNTDNQLIRKASYQDIDNNHTNKRLKPYEVKNQSDGKYCYAYIGYQVDISTAEQRARNQYPTKEQQSPCIVYRGRCYIKPDKYKRLSSKSVRVLEGYTYRPQGLDIKTAIAILDKLGLSYN